MRKITILLTLLFLSCYEYQDNIRVRVINNSNSKVANIKVYTSNNKNEILFNNLKNDGELNFILNLKQEKSDGDYFLEYVNNKNQKVIYHNGYFSNGIPLDKEIIFTIENDTIEYNSN